jgi:phage gp45-like
MEGLLMSADGELYGVSIKNSSAGTQTVFMSGTNNCNLTTTIQGYTGTTDIINTTPVVNPYGFLSIPDQAYNAVIGNMGIRSQQPFVFGYTNAVQSTSPLTLAAGETGLYNSTTYSFELKLAEVRARFAGISCKLFNGNSSQTIFDDVITEILDMISYLNTTVFTTYNTHTHISSAPTVATSPPTPLLTSYVPTGNLTTDQTYLNANHCFIDDAGTTL